MTNAISDEMLVAFLHGELNELEIKRVEAAMAADPAIAAKAEAFAVQDDDVRAAFNDILAAPVPDNLVATIMNTRPEATVVDLAAVRERKSQRSWGWPQFGAMAATLALGLIAGWQTSAPGPSGSDALVIASADGPVLGSEAQSFLASAQSGDQKQLGSIGTASVTISFRTADGVLCRQFAVAGQAGATDGVACREGSRWMLQALGARAGEAGEMRTASGDAAPAVLATVDALIDGEPLDAAAEKAALANK